MGVTTVLNAPRDIGALRSGDWPLRPLVGEVIGREKSFQVIIRQSVLDAIAIHGKSDTTVEVCGVLVGNIYSDGAAPYAIVEAAIAGEYTAGRSTQVTFTSETWTQINDVKDREYPSKQILGWYHTHPGFGIFLSEMDLFIHQSFFAEPWQLAFVFDPKSGEEGLFVWRDGKIVQDGFLVDHDTDTPPADTGTEAGKGESAAPSGTVAELSARIQALESRSKWLTAGGLLAVLLAIAWPVVVAAYLPQVTALLHPVTRFMQPDRHGSPPPVVPAFSVPPAHAVLHSTPATAPATRP
ncbi:MAG TPA: Mov34/MPN/PAD-1 family protein [Tepidisphaeraceae bacterium]|jgi:proteasome lid subunit RPN8/RPN11|nr:Mov34/MPN/PAD-1 family protein [Tepidisphaeraceae bacterium]